MQATNAKWKCRLFLLVAYIYVYLQEWSFKTDVRQVEIDIYV
jgi:hypothetical protein